VGSPLQPAKAVAATSKMVEILFMGLLTVRLSPR
jgi:hypothetical protein